MYIFKNFRLEYVMQEKCKQEIKNSIEVYLAKNEFRDYRIPAIRQRPVLLMAFRESAKPRL